MSNVPSSLKYTKSHEWVRLEADGTVTVGSSVKMGYFAQHAMDLIDGGLTVFEQLESAFPQAGQGSLRALAGCFGFSGDDVEKKCRVLSGGEKALTAIALVFSMFQLNPAPFCLLDEVDAPLDDTNTERFCTMVRQMSIHTQFLFISHNKITMEMAQQLVGVTMQESGVSRIVEVDMEEALRMREQLV